MQYIPDVLIVRYVVGHSKIKSTVKKKIPQEGPQEMKEQRGKDESVMSRDLRWSKPLTCAGFGRAFPAS